MGTCPKDPPSRLRTTRARPARTPTAPGLSRTARTRTAPGPGPYGQAPFGYPPAPADRRPGTVTAACWIAIVSSVLTAMVMGLGVLAVFVARDDLVSELRKQPDFDESTMSVDTLVGAVGGVMGFCLVWSLIAAGLGVMALRRSQGARIALAISAGVTAVLALLLAASLVSLLWLFVAAATLVLLFVGGAGDWYARRSPATAPSQPW